MKISSLLLALGLTLAASAPLHAATVAIDNTTSASIASGDRANMRGFAFVPNAGGTGPASPLTQTVELTMLTLFRPGFSDATAPSFGAGAGQLANADAPVFLKIYSSFTGGTTAGDLGTLLGISSNSWTWNQVLGLGANAQTAPPFNGYTFNFANVALDKDTTYWMVYSETGDSSADVTNFRQIVEAGGGAAGSGYLPSTDQMKDAGGISRDWGPYFNATVNTVPEPGSAMLVFLALLPVALRRRRALA